MNFDAKDFRRALGKFATGVTIVTTRDQNGEDLGMTASSFNSVSIDPALILWSIDKNNYGADTFRTAEFFAINVLNDSQVELSNRFARRGEDKFSGITIGRGKGDIALIDGAAAQFECRTWNVYEGGDHYIIVGEVLNYHYAENVNSLVFHNGRYAVSDMHPTMKNSDSSRITDGGLLNDYMLFLLRQALSAYCDHFYPKLQAFNITAEEWRVLTLLTDKAPLDAQSIGQRVFQPPQELSDTLDWLKEKALINENSQGLVSLTDKGQEQAQKLLNMAFEHEKSALSGLSNEQVDALRSGLKTLIQSVG
ncbi:MAG: flavin reductase [Saccharospirillum sp.]|nr:flavin reductase [Saccharospirillum sp.]